MLSVAVACVSTLQEFTEKVCELSEAPEGYDSVKGVKSTEEQPSFFKVSCDT